MYGAVPPAAEKTKVLLIAKVLVLGVIESCVEGISGDVGGNSLGALPSLAFLQEERIKIVIVAKQEF